MLYGQGLGVKGGDRHHVCLCDYGRKEQLRWEGADRWEESRAPGIGCPVGSIGSGLLHLPRSGGCMAVPTRLSTHSGLQPGAAEGTGVGSHQDLG